MSAKTPPPAPPRHGEGRSSALDRERLRYENALARVVAALPRAFTQIPEVERAWLFGSYLHGRRDLCTDIDLIVLVHSDRDIVTRTAWLYGRLAALLDLNVDMDIIAYTPEEFAQMRERGFLKYALARGRIIYERAD
ncbi:MAG: nucleotidyltransferase domain-containing protein [Candidatus Bipolaricaulota bacterium]|nr:nucleotidyltransferase domain-containing protein [Candidatus Bipolaricaulota bacterium]MCS7274380.1 nucleotidyltransferase domain-containing protein [Candidatus Bipolaricaulota bacterium]MDW8111555.1 nucleotidyltransferase domain-containing protein [Candidatus Bipolaricaulota bacterium]MDW8329986.1 nucleotidyltransferase domain-containing protein [Candidatus Bipolaricaulota bacterium]